jgi:hypothetical protein
VLSAGLPSDVRRAADGLSTTASRKPVPLVLALTLVGVKTQVIRSVSPVLASVTGLDSGVKYVVHEADDVPFAGMVPSK